MSTMVTAEEQQGQETNRVKFFGRIVPERAQVEIPKFTKTFENDDEDLRFGLTVSVEYSQFVAIVKPIQGEIPLWTLKNSVENLIRVAVDALGFSNLCGYSVEVVSIAGQYDEHTVWGVKLRALSELEDEFELMDNQIRSQAFNEEGRQLRRSLADFRMAIRNPLDSVFYCYRAIESVRRYFDRKHDLNPMESGDRAEGWGYLHEALRTFRYEDLEEIASRQRHGAILSLDEDERLRALEYSWRVIRRFALYLSFDEELPEDIQDMEDAEFIYLEDH